MKVIAAKGTRCPKEENPREYITDDVAINVPETAYYKRLIADGSLIEVSSQVEQQSSQAEPVITSEAKQSKRGGKE